MTTFLFLLHTFANRALLSDGSPPVFFARDRRWSHADRTEHPTDSGVHIETAARATNRIETSASAIQFLANTMISLARFRTNFYADDVDLM